MPRRFTDGYFALGLILGGGAAINLCLWLVFSWQWLDLYQLSEQANTYEQQRCIEAKDAKANGDIASGGIFQSQNTSKSSANSGENHQYSPDWCDLAAQQSMANSTYRMMQAAWITVPVGIVGLILLGFTMWYTRQTLSATRIMAADQNKLVRYQVLPYIAISGFKPEFRWNESAGYVEGRIEFSLRNSGKSPAVIVGHSSTTEVTNSRGGGGGDGNMVSRELGPGDGFGIIKNTILQPTDAAMQPMGYSIVFRIRWTDLDGVEDYHRDVKYSCHIPTAELTGDWRILNSRFHGSVDRNDDWMRPERYDPSYTGK